MNSPLDIAPKILNLMAPLKSNLHSMLALLTNGQPFEVNEIGFTQREDGGVDLQLGLNCETFKDMDLGIFTELLQQVATEAYVVDHSAENSFFSVNIPFKGKKS
ncbi:hypothetical protein [Ewingella americana]|uniref:Uncharacterized protein n=1 Tax=Ewingella americana TaxID=41202 RepID=A0A502GGQ9_9GAMM|nr:hypothetical protein [Ewingella americana]TPG59913.1 hypothetical protein EAH77_15210 [Ewingella americana]